MSNNNESLRLARLGWQSLQSGRGQEAEQQFRQALAVDARSAEALHGLAVIGHQTGNFQFALELFDRALAVDPSNASVHVNRGNTLNAVKKHDEAVESYRRALALSPGLVSALINMANALNAIGQLDAAIEALEQAGVRQPDSAEVLNNLGNLYKDRGEVREAMRCYQAALDIQPLMQQAFSNLLAAGKVDAALTPREVLERHQAWSGWFEQHVASAPLLMNDVTPGRRLRIGYVSPDCHTAVPAFLYPVITAHDRQRFDVFCYFNNPQSAETLQKLNVTGRIMRGLDDQAVADFIHKDGIDILVDIAGHTGHNRLGVFARRVAPVQITWLDYLSTTGLAAMSYRITDSVADPASSEEFHSEALLRMPHTQWCWTPPVDAPDVTELPAIRNGFVTFGSFNNAQKLSDATLDLWKSLLDALPDARIRLAGIPEGRARQRISQALACDPERIDFLPRVDVDIYRRNIADVDIALDPMPFSGATTTLDALWQGVPVLTLPGSTSYSRSTASLLMQLDLANWIAGDPGDFIRRARGFVADRDSLDALRHQLRERVHASTITDVGAFTHSLEALYERAWQSWCTDRAAPEAAHDKFAASHDQLLAVRAENDRGDADQALELMRPLFQLRPQWELLKRELGRAALAWPKLHPGAQAAWQSPLPPPKRVSVSAIICSNRPEYLVAISGQLAEQFEAHEFEVIAITDALSLCEGYNRGAACAKGEVLIFCHDDIDIVHADFGSRVLAHLEEFDIVGVIGSDELVNGNWSHAGPPHLYGQILHRPPDGQGHLYFAAGFHANPAHNIKALDGVFIAMQRHVWEKLRFDEETFDGFHLYDADFSYRASKAGYRIGVAMDLLLIHFSLGTYDARWQKYNRRFLAKYPELSNRVSSQRNAWLHIKLQTLEQVERMHIGLLHYRFGL